MNLRRHWTEAFALPTPDELSALATMGPGQQYVEFEGLRFKFADALADVGRVAGAVRVQRANRRFLEALHERSAGRPSRKQESLLLLDRDGALINADARSSVAPEAHIHSAWCFCCHGDFMGSTEIQFVMDPNDDEVRRGLRPAAVGVLRGPAVPMPYFFQMAKSGQQDVSRLSRVEGVEGLLSLTVLTVDEQGKAVPESYVFAVGELGGGNEDLFARLECASHGLLADARHLLADYGEEDRLGDLYEAFGTPVFQALLPEELALIHEVDEDWDAYQMLGSLFARKPELADTALPPHGPPAPDLPATPA
jgi:hypothetical protein